MAVCRWLNRNIKWVILTVFWFVPQSVKIILTYTLTNYKLKIIGFSKVTEKVCYLKKIKNKHDIINLQNLCSCQMDPQSNMIVGYINNGGGTSAIR